MHLGFFFFFFFSFKQKISPLQDAMTFRFRASNLNIQQRLYLVGMGIIRGVIYQSVSHQPVSQEKAPTSYISVASLQKRCGFSK